MKILFFLRTTTNNEIKRSDFRDIALRLKKKGDEVHVYDTATGINFRVEDDGKLSMLSESKPVSARGIFAVIARLSGLWSFTLKNRGRYDVAHFCYIREEFLILWFVVLKVARKNIATVYGADVGQRNIIKKYFKRFLYHVDIITITGTNGRDLLKKHFNFERLSRKVVLLPLPSRIIKEISDKGKSKAEAKEKLGLSKDEILVVCGSVLSQNEQYEQWVPLLAKSINEERKKVFLFPFSYGNINLLPHYREIIESALPEGSYRIISGWASDEETANLRIATDILISLRKNDQFAGIILESIFTGAVVITGGWLKYSYLEDNNIWHLRVDDFNDLPDRLTEAVISAGDKGVCERLAENSRIITRDFSYDSIINEWESFYKELREKIDEGRIS
jgi:glycosyltransferase involved in cell wall biosynthesis